MAKKYKMLDKIEKAYQKEIAKHAQRLVDAANKRLRRMEQAKIMSPAYYAVMESGGYFSGKGFSGNWNQLMHEYNRVIKFLNMETSTLGGARKYDKKIQNMLGGNVTDNQRKLIFEIFDKMEEMDVLGVEQYGSDKLINYISSNVQSDLSSAKADIGSQEYIRIIEENLKRVEQEFIEVYEKGVNALKDKINSEFRKIK